MVCRKRRAGREPVVEPEAALERAVVSTQQKVRSFNRLGRSLSENDVRLVVLSQLMVELSPGRSEAKMRDAFTFLIAKTAAPAAQIWCTQRQEGGGEQQHTPAQLSLLPP
jgi:hypothetical protein